MSTEEHWFDRARFGMFVHWGAYSAAGRGEWVANRERISQDEYISRYVDAFRAEAYEPKQWAELAVRAGMRYAVLTARHHDGFALWPTEQGNFHAGALGPKRDLIGPYVEAFRSAGLRVGFYYSPADWFHKDYPGAYFRDWPSVDDWASTESRERFIAYYRAQLREIMTWYGDIDYLWYDGCLPDNLQSREANEEILKLQPRIIINERNGNPSHVKISEQSIKPGEPGEKWEACMTLNSNWGWHAGDQRWKTPHQVVQLLTETAAGAGNLLLNVGPRPDGTIPEASAGILNEVGSWLERNGESIYGSSRSPISWSNWGRVTTKGHRVFLHIWNHPGDELCFAELSNKIRSVKVLHGGMDLSFEEREGKVFLKGLDAIQQDALATTLVLECEGEPSPSTRQTTFWIPG